MLKIEKRELADGGVVIEIAGRVALGRECRQIEPQVIGVIEEGAKMVIIDMAGVSHIDSTGIGILADCFTKARHAGADFRIAGAKGAVLEVFQITRLDHVVPFFPDVDSAALGNGRLV